MKDIKQFAQRLGRALKNQGRDIPHGVLLHAIAVTEGYANWHVLSRALTPEDATYLRDLLGAELALEAESRHLPQAPPAGLAARLGTVTGAPPAAEPSPWEDEPDLPVADWRYEVANDDTRLGYRDWVQAQQEQAPIPKGTAVLVRAHRSPPGQGLSYEGRLGVLAEDASPGSWDVADLTDGTSVYGFSLSRI